MLDALYIALLLFVNAMHNVTVDDNDPSITYQPSDSWLVSVFDVLDAGGSHHVISDPDATALFSFTGWFQIIRRAAWSNKNKGGNKQVKGI